ncbi:MAG: SH3 domain-containing protein [Chloroflexi bacterium]|nr:SH3 domain-containing protein [Chloroflexota bacterium]
MANVIGPDVSFYQDDPQTPQGIDFIKMRSNAGYVVIRAGQNLWGDRDFKVNWRESKAAGLPRGSYWFYDSRIDPKRQAEKWASMFEGDFGELPLFGDFEDTYNGPFKGWRHWYTFLERTKELAPGKEIGVYTGYYYWRENTEATGIPAASLNYFKQYPLWIANYGVASPLIPKPWTTWTFWQFTDNGDGTLYGVESLNIDLNYFNGDINAFRQRFGLSDTPLPEPPKPTKFLRVTVPSLKVREGPGLGYTQIGSILLNEVVEEVDSNPDKTWLKIRKKDDSLTGWSFAAYLQRLYASPEPTPEPEPEPEPTPEPEPEPTPPPDDEDENWYRVTASSLKVREGPGLEYDSIGLVYFGEIVERIDSNTDGSWFKIRKQDGSLVGWSFSEYLISVHAPTPEPPPTTTPVPEHKDKNWYRVNATTLNIREAPNLSSAVIAKVYKNDTIPALDDQSNPGWIQTQKLDGRIGWCSKDYLVQITTASRPASITQNLFAGVTYLRKDLTAPRQVVVHVLAVDLQTLKMEFLVTPSPNNTDILCTRTTSQFLEEFKLHAAINGGYFSYLDPSYDPATLCPNGGDPVRISDYAASRGRIYSPKKTIQPVVHIAQKNQVTFNKEPGRVFNAVAGDRMVVQDGVVVKNLAAQAPNPRTAIGLSRNGRWLTLMVVDGRQPGYSEGVTFPELAELLISYGVHTGANMDGGGSSAMVIRGFDGKARVLNSPVDMGRPGRERRVGNHLGLFIKP